MEIREFNVQDIARVTPLYIAYFNEHDGDRWTEPIVVKRLGQMLNKEDSYGLLLEKDGEPAGFALGCFEQFYDGVVYNLTEILIAGAYQKQGLGTELMRELEKRVKEKGAFMISLLAVNDESHDRFYGRLGYADASNLVIKVKQLGSL